MHVLMEPQLPDNIGMVARAMANFGLDDLRLIAPRDGWPNEKARIAASGANYIIDDATSNHPLTAALGRAVIWFGISRSPCDVGLAQRAGSWLSSSAAAALAASASASIAAASLVRSGMVLRRRDLLADGADLLGCRLLLDGLLSLVGLDLDLLQLALPLLFERRLTLAASLLRSAAAGTRPGSAAARRFDLGLRLGLGRLGLPSLGFAGGISSVLLEPAFGLEVAVAGQRADRLFGLALQFPEEPSGRRFTGSRHVSPCNRWTN